MRISRITAPGFKGRNIDVSLGPVNLVVGDNFAGKTAITDAIAIGLLGYLPRLGASNQKLYRLASAEQMAVLVDFDNGKSNHVVLKQDSRGSVSKTENLTFPVPPVLLDAEEYFGLTGKEQVRYVFDRVDLVKTGFKSADLITMIKAIEALPTKIAFPLIQKWCDVIDKGIAERTKNRIVHAQFQTLQDWLANLVKELTEQRKACDARAKECTAVMSALRPGEPMKNVSLDYAKHKNEHNVLIAKLGAARKGVSLAQGDEAQRKQVAHEIKMLTEQIKLLERHLKEQAVVLGKYQSATSALQQDLTDAMECQVSCDTDRHSLQDAIRQAKQESAMLAKLHLCKTCETVVKGRHKDRLEELAVKLSEAERRLVKLEQETKAVVKQVDVVAKQDKQHAEQVDAWEGLKRDIAAKKTRLASLEDAHGSIITPDLKGLARLETECEQSAERLAELESANQLWVTQQSNLQKRDEAEADYAARHCESTILKGIVALLTDAQATVVESVFNSLLTTARKFTDGILKSPLEYQDGELGRMEGKLWVAHEAFSGTESLIAYAGLSVALCQQSQIRIVLMDELGRLTPDNKVRLVQRMATLVKEKVIDQFVGLDVDADDYGPCRKQISVIEVK